MIDFIKRKIHHLVLDKKFSEILTGSAWTISAHVLAIGLGIVANVIIARIYGAEVLGIMAVLNSFLMLITIFAILGTDASILRLIPEHLVKYSPTSAFKVYRKTQYMVIGLSLFTSTVFFFGSDLIADKIFSKPHLSFYFGLVAVFVVFKSLRLLNTQAVRGLKLIKIFAFMQLLPQGANLILLIVLGLFFYNKDIPVYAFLANFVVTGTIGWAIMEYSFKCKMRSDDQVMDMSAKTILTISMPMLMTAMMTFAIGQTGVIMLSIFRSEAEVGYYAIAVKLATLTSLLLSAINSMAAPKFSELYHSNKIDELFYIAKKSAKLIFFTSSPILLVLLIFGKSILGILFGHNFSVAYFALALITIGQFVNSISGSTGFFMNMTGNQNALIAIMIFATSINVGLNLYLIPSIGINGAAVAGMVSICFWNIAALLYIKKKFGKTIAYLPFAR